MKFKLFCFMLLSLTAFGQNTVNVQLYNCWYSCSFPPGYDMPCGGHETYNGCSIYNRATVNLWNLMGYEGEVPAQCAFSDPLPPETILVSVKSTLHVWQFKPRTLINLSLNGTTIGQIKDPRTGGCFWGSNGFYPTYEDCPHDSTTNLFTIPCMDFTKASPVFAGGLPGYHYGADQENTFYVSVGPYGMDQSHLVSLNSVDLELKYISIPSVRYIQALQTQEIYDYVRDAKKYGFTQPGDPDVPLVPHVFYLGDYQPNPDDPRANPHKTIYKDPVVVPFGRAFHLYVRLSGIASNANELVDCEWSISPRIASGKISDIASRAIDIPLTAPQEVSDEYKIKLILTYKYKDAVTGETSILGTQTIDEIPLYTIIGWAFRLEDSNEEKPPTAEMVKLALQYNQGSKDLIESLTNITNGIFKDDIHYYSANLCQFVNQYYNACELTTFDIDLYLRNRRRERISICCADAAFLSSSLLRSVGYFSDFKGFRKDEGPSDDGGLYVTNSLHASGHYNGPNKPGWEAFTFNYHILNRINALVWDSVIRYRDGRESIPIVGEELNSYKTKVFSKPVYDGVSCFDYPSTGISEIIYQDTAVE